MKKEWEVRKLGEVLNIERGGSPRPIKKYLTNSTDGINWIKISDATASDKYIYETKEKITRDGLHKTRVVNEGDFILSNSMSFGRPYIMKTTGCIHDGWLVLKQSGKKTFETEFLYYLLLSPFVFQQFNSKAAGSTVRNLNIALVSSVNVPLPPLPEQKRIVAILDKAFTSINKAKANAEKNLANTKELFESYLNGIFENPGEDWEEKELKEIGVIQTGTTPPTKDKSNYGDYISFVKPAHFKTDGSITTEDSMLSETGLNKGRLFEANSVLMVCIGATIGKTGFSETPVSANQQINALTPSTKYVPKFLYYALISPFVQKQVMIQGKSAQATLPIINKSKWGKLKVNLPKDKKIQTKIVRTLENLKVETKHLEKIYQQKIADLEELKKSILQKAFEGKL
jgi:type I restriction enzyme S subunit